MKNHQNANQLNLKTSPMNSPDVHVQPRALISHSQTIMSLIAPPNPLTNHIHKYLTYLKGFLEALQANQNVGCIRMNDGSMFLGHYIIGNDPALLNVPQYQKQVIFHGEGCFFSADSQDVYFGNWRKGQFHGRGIYVFARAQTIYDGHFEMGQKHGMGTYYYNRNGDESYCGEWLLDQKQGYGMLITQNSLYEGQWHLDREHGEGRVYSRIDSLEKSYEGNFVQGVRQGKGKLFLNDGSVYNGHFERGLPHLEGEIEYANKDKYIGEFNFGQRHGKGAYYFSEGSVFEGRWKNDMKQEGTLVLFNDDRYVGKFVNNQRTHGTYTYSNGDVYEGGWLNDLKEGFGTLKLSNGQVYEGQFHQGQKNGKGQYIWVSGECYKGEFKEDRRSGLGIYRWANGSIYKGAWANERMNGVGLITEGTTEYVGFFRADQFQRMAEPHEVDSLREFLSSD